MNRVDLLNPPFAEEGIPSIGELNLHIMVRERTIVEAYQMTQEALEPPAGGTVWIPRQW